MTEIKAVLCGNPNVGKSTVFNTLTGLHQHTGNWAGKTVESAKGTVKDAQGTWTLIDLPGAYSLLNGSPDELVTADYLLLGDYDVAIVVCDATCLSRSLVLAMQVARLCSRTVVCVNLMDEAKRQGTQIDLTQLERELGLPVVGISARNGQGIELLKERVRQIAHKQSAPVAPETEIPNEKDCIDEMLQPLASVAQKAFLAGECSCERQRLFSMRMLAADQEQLHSLCAGECPIALIQALATTREKLVENPISIDEWKEQQAANDFQNADTIAHKCLLTENTNKTNARRLRIDKLLCSPATGLPVMLLLLLLLFYLTMFGANAPSNWLSKVLFSFEATLNRWFTQWNAPVWLTGAVVHGMYRTLAWVVAVMLPPMAIFFPLFTLLEDLGYLPRIAFNMDRCFHGCQACGKQALCMCMGLGCNAVGVTGSRIIQSPRERMIAILTNALTPCNGRLPFLMTLISAFLVTLGGGWGRVLSASALVGMLALCVCVTLLLSQFLSKTFLRGMSSAYILELPPFRAPKTGQVILRSVLDRTVYVLMRAVSVAAPAGLLLWVLGYLKVADASLLQHASRFLDPFGRLLGMDGVILLAFLLGLPANEIVLPIALMIYLSQNQLMEPMQTATLRRVLQDNGWTTLTALCTALFSMFHWPCGTTILTIYKETKHIGWTLLAILLPTLTGIIICFLVASIAGML